MDTRHEKRIKIIQDLFALSFPSSDDHVHAYEDELSKEILTHTELIDKEINEFAAKYQSDRLAKIDLAILRLAIYEMLIEKKTPPKVIINEAVDLAKEMGGEKSPGFINAVLGQLYIKYNHELTT